MWELFLRTGKPLFYLLYRFEKKKKAKALPAFAMTQAESI